MLRCCAKISAIALFTIVVGALATAGQGQAADGTITGIVVDASTGAPVIGAWVAIVENNRGTVTDTLGLFTIGGVAAGECHLIVTHKAYGTVAGLAGMAVSVNAGKTTKVRIELPGQTGLENKPTGATEQREDVVVEQGRIYTWQDALGGSEHAKKQTGNAESGAIGLCAPLTAPQMLSRVPKDPRRDSESEYLTEECLPVPAPFDMSFQDYGTNGFVDTKRDRFSTFAADVDDASYTLVRRYLTEGNMPPSDAVRVEEFINHFDYGYNPPTDARFRVFTEITESPFEAGVSILKVGIKGREASERQRKPLNLTLVIDVSGSMGYDNRMELVKQSLRILIERLDANDRVGMIAYNTQARVLLEPVSADDHRSIFAAINWLSPGGSTNAEAGLLLGYRMANGQYVYGHNNVVALCSDGVANVGETGPDGIMRKVERFANDGVTLSSFGFGMGNYNDVLLEQLAQRGNGRYAYINDIDEARRSLGENFVQNTQLLARDVKIQIEFNPKAVREYRLVGYENREVADHRFRDNSQDGGEIGAGHEVTALYEIVWQPKGRVADAGTVFVRWTDTDQTEVSEVRHSIDRKRDAGAFRVSRPELRLAIVAGRFAGMLKGTFDGQPCALDELWTLATEVDRELRTEQTQELVQLIELARGEGRYHTVRPDGDDNYRNYRR